MKGGGREDLVRSDSIAGAIVGLLHASFSPPVTRFVLCKVLVVLPATATKHPSISQLLRFPSGSQKAALTDGGRDIYVAHLGSFSDHSFSASGPPAC